MLVLIRLSVFLGVLGAATLLHAQASPTASRLGDLQIGAGFSTANPDYSPSRFNGFAVYADFDFTQHLGVEAEFHYVKGPSPDDFYEKTYEVGGRYHRTYGRIVPYAKGMVGRGVFNFQYGIANLAYNMFAGGIGVDYKLKPYLNLRADYEYQHWMGFPPDGLTPQVLTFGAAYHFH
jgi:opacity protein-like surface antigen